MRATWDEAAELIAAAHVHTIKRYGPDRVVGFSPIPAMSMASYAAGTRFLSLIGGVILSFYDWYADLPPASPQVLGDQTDVPESGDWWNAGYLIIWGTNLPMTRTPDAHFMIEARYRGQKVVVVSPDYAEHTKFADHWLAGPARHRRRAGDGDGPRDPEGVLRRSPGARTSRTTRGASPTCRCFVTLRERDGAYVPDRFLRASDLDDAGGEASTPSGRPSSSTRAPGEPAVPNGSLGLRYGERRAVESAPGRRSSRR